MLLVFTHNSLFALFLYFCALCFVLYMAAFILATRLGGFTLVYTTGVVQNSYKEKMVVIHKVSYFIKIILKEHCYSSIVYMSIPMQTPASVLAIPLVAPVETALGLGVATVIRTATAWMTAALTSGTSVHHLVSVY